MCKPSWGSDLRAAWRPVPDVTSRPVEKTETPTMNPLRDPGLSSPEEAPLQEEVPREGWPGIPQGALGGRRRAPKLGAGRFPVPAQGTRGGWGGSGGRQTGTCCDAAGKPAVPPAPPPNTPTHPSLAVLSFTLSWIHCTDTVGGRLRGSWPQTWQDRRARRPKP